MTLTLGGSGSGAPGPQGPQGPQGLQGLQGLQGAQGLGWLQGAGAPAAGLGRDGEAYVDNATGDIYAKASGAWAKTGSIKGPSNPNATDSLALGGRDAGAWKRLALQPQLRKPSYVSPSQVITTMQAGHGFTVGGLGATGVVNDTTSPALGSQCATVTTVGNGVQANLGNNALTAFSAVGKALRVTVRVANIAHLSKLSLYAGTAALANFWTWTLQNFANTQDAVMVQSGEWVTLTLSWHDVSTPTGTPDRSALTCLRLAVYDDGTGVPVTASLQAVETVPDQSALYPNGVVLICFDDSYASPYTIAKPLMDKYRFPATSFNIADMVGQPGRCTLAQMAAARDLSGWEQAGHAFANANHNARYTTLSPADLEADLQALKIWGQDNGFRLDGLAYPGGSFNAAVCDVVRKYFTYGRTISSTTKETIQPANPFRIRALSSISTFAGGITPTQVLAELDKAKANASVLPLTLHDIVTTAPIATSQLKDTDLATILARIDSNGMAALTFRDWLAKVS